MWLAVGRESHAPEPGRNQPRDLDGRGAWKHLRSRLDAVRIAASGTLPVDRRVCNGTVDAGGGGHLENPHIAAVLRDTTSGSMVCERNAIQSRYVPGSSLLFTWAGCNRRLSIERRLLDRDAWNRRLFADVLRVQTS